MSGEGEEWAWPLPAWSPDLSGRRRIARPPPDARAGAIMPSELVTLSERPQWPAQGRDPRGSLALFEPGADRQSEERLRRSVVRNGHPAEDA